MKLGITCIFLLSFLTGSGQDDQYLKQHWFTDWKVCSQQFLPDQFFPAKFPNPDDIWKVSSIVNVSAVGGCRKTAKSVVTNEVHLGLSYVDLDYANNTQAASVFNAISMFLKDEKKDWHSEFSFFCKPGKVFCLSKAKSRIRVVSLNTCAYMKDFEKLMAYYRKLNTYDAVIFVKCGNAPRDVELVEKK